MDIISLNHRSMRSFETGLRFDTLILNWEQKGNPPSVMALDCLSESRKTKSYDPEYKPMSLIFFTKIFLHIMIIPFAAYIVLYIERRKYEGKKLRKARRKMRRMKRTLLKNNLKFHLRIIYGI